MTLESKVVKTLKGGDVVTVEVELEGTEGAWCGIVEQRQTTISGYVQCKYLERGELQKKVWKDVGPSGSKPDNNITRVTLAGNTVLVPVTLSYRGNTVEALLVLDTGSSITLISTEIAARLNIYSTETRKVHVQVVGGALVEVALARLSYMEVEPHTKKDTVIGIVEDNGPLKYDGLLGMDFLRGLKYHIDFENRIIRWNE
jgi:predicted aspartyl protease